jgi:uncharacterized phage protein gp47/JayE
MANLSTLAFTDIVRNVVTAIQAGSSQLLNLTVGSVLRAIVEAQAGVILWLQGLITYVLTLTRFNTSKGIDADSWAADFGFTRVPAKAATGQVTFTRFTTTTQSVVPFGTLVQTGDGTQTFTVNNDPTGTGYSLAAGGYVIGIGVTTRTVGITAQLAGSGGNVLANTITSMGQGIPGVDTVTNASAFTNGLNAESDISFYARFQLFIAALSKATKVAIFAAIANMQQGVQATITENFDYDGTYDPGSFYVVIDDGSGAPSDALMTNVGNAIEAVRALGIRFATFKTVVVNAGVSLTVTSGTGFDHPTVVGAVGLALTAFINSLPLGAGLPYTQLAAVAYGVSGVVNVSAVLLNSTTADIAGDPKSTIKASPPVSVA